MNRQRLAKITRTTLTFVGLAAAAMVFITGLAVIAVFLIVFTGLGNFGSNK